jgi:DnaJ-class molecular chaperone
MEREVKVIRMQRCIACAGKGYVVNKATAQAQTCKVCEGRRKLFFPKAQKPANQQKRTFAPELKLWAGTHPAIVGV